MPDNLYAPKIEADEYATTGGVITFYYSSERHGIEDLEMQADVLLIL